MRPDRATISAYLDGEVLPPFNDEIERALSEDPEAAKAYNQFLSLRERLPRSSEDQIAQSAERSWAAVGSRLKASPRGFWHRAVALPAPVLAAAATAVVALTAAFLWMMLSGQPAPDSAFERYQNVDVTLRIEEGDIDQVLEWLEARDMLGEVSIQLPEQQFRIIGEPVLVRPASYEGERSE